VSDPLFAVGRGDDGVASLRVATDDEPYLGPAWVHGFSRALEGLGNDESARAVVLEGGARHFSAGASRQALTAAPGDRVTAYAAQVPRALLALPVPVVAAAAGHALGGGLLLALWCDLVVLAEESLYGANFMALGLTPGMGATIAVEEAFGPYLGRDMLLTGRRLTGREIRAAGCPVSHAVLPRDDVRRRAMAAAREIAEAPRPALVLLKRMLAASRAQALERALGREHTAHARLLAAPGALDEIARRHPAPGGPAPTAAS
jgi:enoyl-CoA hydratase/carnithine racemase